MSRRPDNPQPAYLARQAFVIGLFVAAFGVLVWRAYDLHIVEQEFLQSEGNARYLRTITTKAPRGTLFDRNGEPLAVSTSVESVSGVPQRLLEQRARLPELARVLGRNTREMLADIEAQARRGREFVYLKRSASPSVVWRAKALGIEGLFTIPAYRRFYPAAEVPAHVVGFTSIDDEGLEGIELLYNERLQGKDGSMRVIKDRLGRIVERVERLEEAEEGESLYLSIDRRIQYVAMRALERTVSVNGARAGSVVVLDTTTGEVLAMANQPTYNPNNRSGLVSDHYRNRAVTDVFEPGSTIKPFTIAAALDSGHFGADSYVDTSPGYLELAGFRINDEHDYGYIDLATILQKSSNVGAARVALQLEPKQLWDVLTHVGFGIKTYSGFPGEANGSLSPYQMWRRVGQATMSYGYGFSATALQLAKAYSVLAADGRLHPVRLLRLEPGEKVEETQVLSARTARELRRMLERVVAEGGTGTHAQIPGYRIAGKTGTVRKSSVGGYIQERYRAVFAGFAPATRPRLVVVAVIDEPSGGAYYGGQIAAPLFAEVMEGALRLLAVPPDAPESLVKLAGADTSEVLP